MNDTIIAAPLSAAPGPAFVVSLALSFALSCALLRDLAEGDTAQVAVGNTAAETITFNVPVAGLAAAVAAMRKEAGHRTGDREDRSGSSAARIRCIA